MFHTLATLNEKPANTDSMIYSQNGIYLFEFEFEAVDIYFQYQSEYTGQRFKVFNAL